MLNRKDAETTSQKKKTELMHEKIREKNGKFTRNKMGMASVPTAFPNI